LSRFHRIDESLVLDLDRRAQRRNLQPHLLLERKLRLDVHCNRFYRKTFGPNRKLITPERKGADGGMTGLVGFKSPVHSAIAARDAPRSAQSRARRIGDLQSQFTADPLG